MTPKHWATLLSIACACACSSKTTGSGGFDQQQDTDSGTNGGGATGGLIGASSGGSGASSTGAGGTGAGGGLTGPACVGDVKKAEAMPVDMYIMFDQSSSMYDASQGAIIPNTNPPVTWWQAAAQAVGNFVKDPMATGMGVGIQFFPLNGVAPDSCTAPYSTPDVEIAPLPGNADAIIASVAKHGNGAFTPTAPALQGAIDHMVAWAPNHKGRAPVVVFVTDGFPTECDPQQLPDIANIAKTAFNGTEKIRTFVVGFHLGQGGTNLDQIAAAGGTNKAFLIDGGDIGGQFVKAMLGIATAPLQCEFAIPTPSDPTMSVDFNKIDVQFTPNGETTPEDIPKVPSLGSCGAAGGQGWYYDDNTHPKNIEICPSTCSRFGAGAISIALGCAPVVVING